MAQDIASSYSKCSDEELLRLAAQRGALGRDALAALNCELAKRNLERVTPAAPPLASGLPNVVEEPHRGVRGWLLQLVLYLTIVNPLRLASAWLAWRSSQSESHIPLLRYFLFAERSSFALLVTFGFYAGIGLLQMWPKAVQLAKSFLVLEVINCLAVQFMIWIASRELGTQPKYDLMWAAPQISWSLVWLAYLTRSRRVAATYGSLTHP